MLTCLEFNRAVRKHPGTVGPLEELINDLKATGTQVHGDCFFNGHGMTQLLLFALNCAVVTFFLFQARDG